MSTTPNSFDDAAKYILLTLYLGEGFTEQYTQAVLNKQFENPKLAIALQALQQFYLTHHNRSYRFSP